LYHLRFGVWRPEECECEEGEAEGDGDCEREMMGNAGSPEAGEA